MCGAGPTTDNPDAATDGADAMRRGADAVGRGVVNHFVGKWKLTWRNYSRSFRRIFRHMSLNSRVEDGVVVVNVTQFYLMQMIGRWANWRFVLGLFLLYLLIA